MAQSNHAKLAAAKAQLAVITTRIAELEVAAANEVDFSRVVEGAEVTFNFGKKPNIQALTGTVLGLKSPEDGAKGAVQARVAVGTGFNADVKTIYLPYITAIVSSPVDEAGDNTPAAE